jgi:hypothetical protein
MQRSSFVAVDRAIGSAGQACPARGPYCWMIVADLDEVVDLGSLADRYAGATRRNASRPMRQPG